MLLSFVVSFSGLRSEKCDVLIIVACESTIILGFDHHFAQMFVVYYMTSKNVPLCIPSYCIVLHMVQLIVSLGNLLHIYNVLFYYFCGNNINLSNIC